MLIDITVEYTDENDCTKDGDDQKTCGMAGSCVCKTDGYQIGKTGICEELPAGNAKFLCGFGKQSTQRVLSFTTLFEAVLSELLPCLILSYVNLFLLIRPSVRSVVYHIFSITS